MHKFSIGKDFNSLEIDEDELLNITNMTIYSNVPPTLSTKAIRTSKKMNEKLTQTSTTRPLNFITNFLPDTSMHTYLPFELTTSTDEEIPTKEQEIPSQYFSTKQQTNANPLVDEKWNKIRRKIKLVNKNSGINLLNDIINDILVAKDINYTNLTKGRSVEDTRLILNYMLLALHQIKAKDQESFSSVNFLDRVILDPLEVSPDGLFEKDIVLSRDQAFKIFSKFFVDSNSNVIRDGRKVIKEAVYRWPLPIYYVFDGLFSNF